MKYNYQIIDPEKLNQFNQSLEQAIKTATPHIEEWRCSFTLKDDSLIYYYTILDWLDAKIDVNQIDKFIFYQPFNAN